MSAIPSAPIGSILQSGAAQKDAGRPADAARTADVEASRRSAAGPDAFLEIEATDADTQVHTDSGGLGGQGRQDAQSEAPAESADEEASVSIDEAGRPHIDLSA